MAKSNKPLISVLTYREWEQHPMTKLLCKIFSQMYVEDAVTLTQTVNINKPCEAIALQMAQFKGRQQVLEKFHNLDLLKEFILDPNVEWEK
jgi:hypothetical protein